MRRRLREAVLWAGAALGLVAVATGLAVAFLGFSLLVFRSGSMSPEIPTGGLALARSIPAADLERGDVVSVIAANGDRITHRVQSATLRGDTASLVLRGDANSTDDSEVYEVARADRVVASVPYGGYVLAHALTPPGLVTAGALGLILVVLGFTPAPGDPRGGRPDGGDRTRGGRHAGRRPGRRTRVTAAVGVLALVTAGGGLAATDGGAVTGTWARFTDQATVRTGSFDAARYFTCSAATTGIATPYLYWRLDEAYSSATQTTADASGSNRTGTFQNADKATFGQARACRRDTGSAVTFNGTTPNTYATSAYVTPTSTTAVAGPDVFTLSIWFRTNTGSGGRLIGFGSSRTGQSGTYDRHLYLTNDGRVTFGVYPNTVRTVQSGAGFNDNQWHHAAATLSSAGMRLYVDGVAYTPPTTDPVTTSGQSFNGFWRVGYDNLGGWTGTPTSHAFAGTLDDAAVWTSALSDTDIAALARSGR